MSEQTPAKKKKGDTAQRIQTAAVLVPLLLYMLYGGPPWMFPAATALVASLAAVELSSMVAPESRIYAVYQVIGTLSLLCVTGDVVPAQFMLPILVVMIVFGLLFNLATPEPVDRAALRIGYAVTGPLYVGGLFGLLIRLFGHPNGGSWALLCMICSFLSDTGGYFAGRALGKHKLAPRVSPKKTVEGSIGGIAASVVGCLVAHFWFLPELSIPAAIGLGVFATFLGQLGDLCESLIKRSTGVKDSGSVLPGHGGMLDRSDALLFATSLIWLYVEYLS